MVVGGGPIRADYICQATQKRAHNALLVHHVKTYEKGGKKLSQKPCLTGSSARRKKKTDKIKEMERNATKLGQTQIFMDTPYRNNQLMEELLKTCNHHTLLSINRDLSGKQELAKTMSIGQWKTHKPELHKVPTIFCISSL